MTAEQKRRKLIEDALADIREDNEQRGKEGGKNERET